MSQLAKFVEIFENRQLEVMEVDGRKAMTAEMVGIGLGYDEPRKHINKLFNRHRDEFEEEKDFGGSKLTTPGGIQDIIVFYGTGVVLLTMFSRQPVAKQFRAWAKHILAGKLRDLAQQPLIPAGKRAISEEEYHRLTEYFWRGEMKRHKRLAEREMKPRLRPRGQLNKGEIAAIIDGYEKGLANSYIAQRLNRSVTAVSWCIRTYRMMRGGGYETRS